MSCQTDGNANTRYRLPVFSGEHNFCPRLINQGANIFKMLRRGLER